MTIIRTAAAAAALTLTTAGIPAVAAQSGSNAVMPQTQGAAPQQANVDDATVNKVGTALRHVATIRQQYSQRAQATNSPQQRADLTQQARQEMVKAIGDQGLSVQQYEQVIQLAQADPTLKQRLISVAQSGQ